MLFAPGSSVSDEADRLASVRRGCVVAAAGCGKTELIAKTVARLSGRQLVLTHTNAGVEAIQRRLRRLGVGRDRVGIDTIDGWCYKYLRSFPRLSGGPPDNEYGFIDWVPLREAMREFLSQRVAQTVVDASYDGVFVDEYQDTDAGQHAVVTRLAQQIPVRVLGDPLQAVFGFDGALPDWQAEVETTFPRELTLTVPWRWKQIGANSALGDWLGDVRTEFAAGNAVALMNHEVKLIELDSASDWQRSATDACFSAASQGGSVVAVCKWPGDRHLLAKMTGGLFQCVEPLEAKEAVRTLRQLQEAAGVKRCTLLLDFFLVVAVNAVEPVKELTASLAEGGDVSADLRDVAAHLRRVHDDGGPAEMGTVLHLLTKVPGVRVFRWELLRAAMDALRDVSEVAELTFVEALRKRRALTSHIGRRLARCTVGSTLLVKGMEFDHAVVIHTGGPKGFTLNDLYVAMTRGAKSLTVVSVTDTIRPYELPAPGT